MPKTTPLSITNSLCFLCLLFCGCGDPDGLVSLHGVVTVDGRPAPEGISLEFSPVGKGSPSYGTTDSEGKFEAAFTHRRKGILPGEHVVKLVPGGPAADAGRMPEPGEKPKESILSQFPREYYQEIIRITVKKGGQTIDIPLETKKE